MVSRTSRCISSFLNFKVNVYKEYLQILLPVRFVLLSSNPLAFSMVFTHP